MSPERKLDPAAEVHRLEDEHQKLTLKQMDLRELVLKAETELARVRRDLPLTRDRACRALIGGADLDLTESIELEVVGNHAKRVHAHLVRSVELCAIARSALGNQLAAARERARRAVPRRDFSPL
jgi:hypothetical protein